MKVTQAHIAQRLKLSIATVSRALRGDPAITPEICAEVMAMAAKLGYHPKGQKFLSTKDPTTIHRFIGVVVKIPIDQDAWAPDDIAHGYLSGMSEVSTDLNVSLIVHHVSDNNVNDLMDPGRRPPMIRDESVHGLVLIHHIPGDIVKHLSRSIPCTAIVHDVPEAGIDLIDMDNYYGIGAVMDIIHHAGHRKIGFIGWRPHLTWSQARLAAYIQSLMRLGLPYDSSLVHGEMDFDAVRNQIDRGVRAWVCSIDTIGYRLCRDLLDLGYNIPGDVSIAGFNGITPLLDCPQLTTAKPPLKAMGAFALNRLINRINNPLHQPIKILHRCEVIAGTTTGKPKT